MYMSLCIAALVMCSGRESLIVRASRARSLYKGEAPATCALSVQRSTALLLSSASAVFLSTGLPASLSEHQCGAGGRERERPSTSRPRRRLLLGEVQAPLVMRLRFEPMAVRCPHWVATRVSLRYGLYAWLSLDLLLLASLAILYYLYLILVLS